MMPVDAPQPTTSALTPERQRLLLQRLADEAGRQARPLRSWRHTQDSKRVALLSEPLVLAS